MNNEAIMTMTKQELKGFRNDLTAKESEWKNAIRSREAIAIETNSDVLDQIQHATERELELGRLERESNLLHDVRSALHRIDTDMFGFCLNCEEEINPKRLAAVPWARFCITCQEAADNEGEHPSSPTPHAALLGPNSQSTSRKTG
jgi:DnaK suppressor protein